MSRLDLPLSVLNGVGYYRVSNRVVRGVDVFAVGKEQLWRWVGYRGYQRLGEQRLFRFGGDTMAKGSYVVVELDAMFGSLGSYPAIVASATSLAAALDLVELLDTGMYHTSSVSYGESLGVWGFGYEIWHILDDVRLYAAWEKAIRLCSGDTVGCSVAKPEGAAEQCRRVRLSDAVGCSEARPKASDGPSLLEVVAQALSSGVVVPYPDCYDECIPF